MRGSDTVTVDFMTDTQQKTTNGEMWWAAGVIAGVVALLLIATFASPYGKAVLVFFGILALATVLVKEITGAFARDSGVDAERRATLEKWNMATSVYAAVFGVPAVVVGILGVVL
jgi:hypothetical protein